MTNLELHIHIQLGLQNVNVFQYAGIQREEFDLVINRTIDKIIQKAFRPEDVPPQEKQDLELYFDKYQFTQDDFKVLKVKDDITTVTPFRRGVLRSLPSDYRHLINDRTIISKECYEDGVKVTKSKEVPNRLTKTEDIYTILENPFITTKEESPLSELVDNELRVYTDDKFTVTNIIIDYCKEPAVVDTVNFPNQDLEFSNPTCYKIADFAISYLAKITEQPQQKIVNLESEK